MLLHKEHGLFRKTHYPRNIYRGGTYIASLLIYRYEYHISRLQVVHINVISFLDLIDDLMITLVNIRIIFLYDIPEIVSLMDNDLSISINCGSISAARADQCVSCEYHDHDANKYEDEKSYRIDNFQMTLLHNKHLYPFLYILLVRECRNEHQTFVLDWYIRIINICSGVVNRKINKSSKKLRSCEIIEKCAVSAFLANASQRISAINFVCCSFLCGYVRSVSDHIRK